MQILEGEIQLREETRVVEQAKRAVVGEEHDRQSHSLAETQRDLGRRIEDVGKRILDLPDAETEFARELKLLQTVATVMEDAAGILASRDTGPPAIAAETEAIELLLQSKRFNPRGGGGGGDSPGGGGGGTTSDAAIALIGRGVNPREVREDRGVVQATGSAEKGLPDEFRDGLDSYFQQLERSSP